MCQIGESSNVSKATKFSSVVPRCCRSVTLLLAKLRHVHIPGSPNMFNMFQMYKDNAYNRL